MYQFDERTGAGPVLRILWSFTSGAAPGAPLTHGAAFNLTPLWRESPLSGKPFGDKRICYQNMRL